LEKIQIKLLELLLVTLVTYMKSAIGYYPVAVQPSDKSTYHPLFGIVDVKIIQNCPLSFWNAIILYASFLIGVDMCSTCDYSSDRI